MFRSFSNQPCMDGFGYAQSRWAMPVFFYERLQRLRGEVEKFDVRQDGASNAILQ